MSGGGTGPVKPRQPHSVQRNEWCQVLRRSYLPEDEERLQCISQQHAFPRAAFLQHHDAVKNETEV